MSINELSDRNTEENQEGADYIIYDDISYHPSDLREIGDEATWILSSAKSGNGANFLRDNNLDTFWQSDGPSPHFITIQFNKKIVLKVVSLYLDYKLDESYTPCQISVRGGNSNTSMSEMKSIHLDSPVGWIIIPLTSNSSDIKISQIAILILSSHQNGRDTHIRQVKIFGPRVASTRDYSTPLNIPQSDRYPY